MNATPNYFTKQLPALRHESRVGEIVQANNDALLDYPMQFRTGDEAGLVMANIASAGMLNPELSPADRIRMSAELSDLFGGCEVSVIRTSRAGSGKRTMIHFEIPLTGKAVSCHVSKASITRIEPHRICLNIYSDDLDWEIDMDASVTATGI